MKFFRALIKVVCIILAVSLTLTAVFFRKNGVSIVSVKSSDDIRAESVCADISEKSYKKIASSGYLEMYFDKMTTALMIKDISGGMKWYSMPDGTESANVNMTVKAADGNHIMNSQSNSVSFKSFSCEFSADGVKIKYIMTDDEATANKSAYLKKDIAFSVTVDFRLKDGNFYAESSIENLSGNEKCAITSFSVLQYFGSFSAPEEDDFLLIPDGCGAIACPFNEKTEMEYTCKVYGGDISFETEKHNHAVMGAFGMKRGEGAYAAIIGSSQEFAEIKAVSSKNGFSRVYADFSLDYVSCKDDSLYVYRNSSPSVSICYKFLSGGNATYSDMASACREQFIRNGTLSTSSISNCEEVPMSLVLTGAYKSGRWAFKYETYTDFEQAEDIIKRIKAKGVNNLSVRYSGVFEGNSVDVIQELGGEKGLQELAEYADSQNVKIYPELNVLGYDSAFGNADFSAARNMNKMPFDIVETNGANQTRVCKCRTMKNANKYIDSLIVRSDEYNVSGYCFADSGKILTSDFSAGGAKRTEYKQGTESHITAVSAVGDVMVATGNIYTVKGAASVIDVPVNVSYEESAAYRRVPFVQSVLHGMTVLSSPALNTSDNIQIEMLRCIEYGLCPTFSVVYSKPEGCKNNIGFEDNAKSIIDVYSEISGALNALEGERITEHTAIKNGVFCTTYGNSTRIYVNYNKELVTVNGVTVPAQGYIRID